MLAHQTSFVVALLGTKYPCSGWVVWQSTTVSSDKDSAVNSCSPLAGGAFAWPPKSEASPC